jgi:hypothetical protein
VPLKNKHKQPNTGTQFSIFMGTGNMGMGLFMGLGFAGCI